MNLAVNPINLNGCNCPKPQVEFGKIPVRVVKLKHEEGMLPVFRKRDEMADIFSELFEKDAKRIGLNTDKLAQKGFCLNFIPKEPLNSEMAVFVLNKENGFLVSTPSGIPRVATTDALENVKTLRDLARYNQEDVMPFVKGVKSGFSAIA